MILRMISILVVLTPLMLEATFDQFASILKARMFSLWQVPFMTKVIYLWITFAWCFAISIQSQMTIIWS